MKNLHVAQVADMIPAKLFHDVLHMHIIDTTNKHRAEKGYDLLPDYDAAKTYEMLTPFIMLAELERDGDIGAHGKHVLVICHEYISGCAGCSYEVDGHTFSVSEYVTASV